MNARAREVARANTPAWRSYVLDPPESRARLQALADYCREREVDLRATGYGSWRRFRMLADYFAELAEGAEEE